MELSVGNRAAACRAVHDQRLEFAEHGVGRGIRSTADADEAKIGQTMMKRLPKLEKPFASDAAMPE